MLTPYHNLPPVPLPPARREAQALMRAHSLYRAAAFAASVGRILSWLARRPNHLLDLALIPPTRVAASHYIGLHPVPIASIVGSQGRARDFDPAFNPLRDFDRSRWVNLAALRLLGHDLPPVDLIELHHAPTARSYYFVIDGHHRISIARALGQESIDALIVRWHLTGPLPWHPAPAPTSPLPALQTTR